MKIGITCYPTYGGSGVVGAELGVELAERGHEVHFIASALPFRAKGNQSLIYFHEVEMMSYPLFEHLPYALALSTKMAEVVQAYDLDVLHVHYAIPHSVSAFLARSMLLPRKIPFITTLHGTDITLVGMDRSYWGITKFAIEQSDGITAISNQLKQKTLEVFGIEKNIEVIYNFVNCNKYRRNANPEYRKLFAAEGEKNPRTLVQLPAREENVGCGGDIFSGAREGALQADSNWRWAGPVCGGVADSQEGLTATCVFSRQTGKRGRHARNFRCAAAAKRAGIIWSGGAGGDGLRGTADRQPRGRPAGASYAWRGWVSGRSWRCESDG